MGLSGRVLRRVETATKVALLDLLEEAIHAGWSFRGACRELELAEVRAYRWRERRAGGELDDRAPGGHPMHGLLPEEIAQIVALYHEWGEVDRSHRKLAHRGSYLSRVWVSPASVRRVLAGQGLHLNPPPRPGRSVRKPFPDWVEYRPNQAWIYDTTHFPRARVAVTVVEDLVSRKWLAHIASAEETSTQVEIVFTDALAAEGLLPLVEALSGWPGGLPERRRHGPAHPGRAGQRYRPGLVTLWQKHGCSVALQEQISKGGVHEDGHVGYLGVFLDHDPADFGLELR